MTRLRWLIFGFVMATAVTAYAAWTNLTPSACVSTASAPSYTEGTSNPCSSTLAGSTRFTLDGQLGGEHIGATEGEGYIRTRLDVLPSPETNVDAQIKGSAGYVSHISCAGTDAAATAGTIILYDSLTETGTVIYTIRIAALDYHSLTVHPIGYHASTGLYLGFTTTADVYCTVFYR